MINILRYYMGIMLNINFDFLSNYKVSSKTTLVQDLRFIIGRVDLYFLNKRIYTL